MKLKLTILMLSLAFLIEGRSQATLTNQYRFNGDVNDSVGSSNGTATTATSFIEAPTFSTFPIAAPGYGTINLGTNNASGLKSGFSINPSVISAASGSISLWINPTVLATTGDFDYIINGTLGAGPILGVTRAGLGYKVGDQSEVGVSGLTVGGWNHIAMTWDNAAGTTSLYLGGNLVSTTSFVANSIAPNGLNFGNWAPFADSSVVNENQFVGSLAKLEFYSGQLTQTQVSALAIPEPSTYAMLGIGLMAGYWIVVQKSRKKSGLTS